MATITLINTAEYIKLAREIRNLNDKKSSNIAIDFSEDNQRIHMNGEIIYIPNDIDLISERITISGEIIETGDCLCVIDAVRPKTVNVHLDSVLVGEINAIRDFIINNQERLSSTEIKDTATQHAILLAVLRRGVKQFKKDFKM